MKHSSSSKNPQKTKMSLDEFLDLAASSPKIDMSHWQRLDPNDPDAQVMPAKKELAFTVQKPPSVIAQWSPERSSVEEREHDTIHVTGVAPSTGDALP